MTFKTATTSAVAIAQCPNVLFLSLSQTNNLHTQSYYLARINHQLKLLLLLFNLITDIDSDAASTTKHVA